MAAPIVNQPARTVKRDAIVMPQLGTIAWDAECEEYVGKDSTGREYFGQTRSEVMAQFNEYMRVLADHLRHGLTMQDVRDMEYWADARQTGSLW